MRPPVGAFRTSWASQRPFLPLYSNRSIPDRRGPLTAHRPSFRAALAFTAFAGEIAEAMDHHPDIDIRYRKVTLTLTTHSEGGKLTSLDFAFARAVDGR